MSDETKKTEILKADLQLKAGLSEMSKDRYSHVVAAKEKLPGARIGQQIQYLENMIMPAVAQKRGGKDSADYKFFEGLIQSLKWCLVMYDKLDYMLREDGLLRLEKQILCDRVLLLERELQRFETLEQLYTSEFLEKYDKGVRERIKQAGNGKNS